MAKIKFERENKLGLLSKNNIGQAGTAIAIQRDHLKWKLLIPLGVINLTQVTLSVDLPPFLTTSFSNSEQL